MFNLKNSQFAGRSDEVFAEAQRIEAMCIAKMEAGYRAEAVAADALPRMYDRKGNVGVISVRGPLINTENDMTAFFGVSTYPAIREAFVYAAADSEVDTIMLDIESGGGQVSGVADTARLIANVNKIKPVTAYTGDLAASAAYWLASSAGKFYAGDLAITGSIGVITTHVSYADALKKEGVDVTILRMGDNKALGHPAEKLSEKAKNQILEQMSTVYDAFTSTVAANRGISIKTRDSWANGNEFMGADAVEVGLVDGIATADKVYAQLAVDKKFSLNNTQNNNKRADVKTPIKATLDSALLAAVEAGTATAEQLAQVAAAREAAVAAQVATAATASVTETAAPETAADEAAAVPSPTAAVEAAVEAAKPESDIVAFLRTELAAERAALVALTVENAQLKAKVADHAEAFNGLCEIARNGINVMAIGLGGSASSMENLSGAELVAKHSIVAGDFKNAFKTDGVAVTAPDVEAKPTASNVTPIERARLASTGLV